MVNEFIRANMSSYDLSGVHVDIQTLFSVTSVYNFPDGLVYFPHLYLLGPFNFVRNRKPQFKSWWICVDEFN